MTATLSAVCCLARAGASGDFVVMTATISALLCLARAGASGNFVLMNARVLSDLLQVFVMMAGVLSDLLQVAVMMTRVVDPPNCSTFLVWGRMGPLALGRLEGLPLMRHYS